MEIIKLKKVKFISVKKNLKISMLKIKNTAKLERTVIIQVNVEVLHIACVI